MSWLSKSRSALLRYLGEDETEGQGLVEYALIILFVVLACFAALTSLGQAILSELWSVVNDVLIPAMGG